MVKKSAGSLNVDSLAELPRQQHLRRLLLRNVIPINFPIIYFCYSSPYSFNRRIAEPKSSNGLLCTQNPHKELNAGWDDFRIAELAVTGSGDDDEL